MISFIEVLDRAHTGPLCEQKDWGVEVIPSKVREELREHGIQTTFDREIPVSAADGVADEFWRAELEQAFIEEDVIRCGHYKPEMILSAKAILPRNSEPTGEENGHALKDNLCRHTRYVKPVGGILSAARKMRRQAR